VKLILLPQQVEELVEMILMDQQELQLTVATVDQAEADLLHGYQLLTTQVELETHHL
jgi:hypothetical protein